MRTSKLIFKFSLLFIFWIGGISLCNAACDGLYFNHYYDEDGNVFPIEGDPVCVEPAVGESGDYCGYASEGGGVYYKYGTNSVGDCEESGHFYYNAVSAPLTDAAPVLILLLGVYGIYLYRKRIALK